MTAEIVRLPTAAKCKVRYPKTKAERKARELHRKMHPELQFPENLHLWPFQRKALASAKIIDSIEQTPALLIVTAMFSMLSELDRMKVKAYCAIAGLKAPIAGTQTVEWLSLFDGDYGDAVTVHRALERLRNGEWE